MSLRRGRKYAEPAFPYERSVIASIVVVILLMLLVAALADPESGQIRAPHLVWLALAAFPVSIAAIFYAERLRKKRQSSGPGQRTRASRMTPRMRRTQEGSISAKC